MTNKGIKQARYIIGFMLAVLLCLSAGQPTCIAAQNADGAWVREGTNWKYRRGDSSYASDCFLMIDGRKYHFNANGVMDTGWIRVGTRTDRDGKLYDNWYYADTSGALVAGWKKINGTWYYFYLSGRMAADAVVDNGRYYVNDDGVWISNGGTWKRDGKGWWYQSADRDRYWNAEKKDYVNYPTNDVCYIDGAYYGFNASGYMVTGWYDFGWEQDGSHVPAWYYFTSSGKAADGWLLLGKTWYYFDNGYMLSDTVIDGCYVDKDGVYRAELSESYRTGGAWSRDSKGWRYTYAGGAIEQNGRKQIDGVWYCFDGDGYMKTGWVDAGTDWYYYTADGSAARGWQQIGGVWYYFQSDGFMYYNTMVDGYYLNADGAWVPDGPAYATDM